MYGWEEVATPIMETWISFQHKQTNVWRPGTSGRTHNDSKYRKILNHSNLKELFILFDSELEPFV